MKQILLILLVCLSARAHADSYTLYVIEANEPVISESPDLDIPTILNTPGIRVTHTLQTEGIPYTQEHRDSSPATDPFGDSSDSSETSDRNEVGTYFQIKEDGDDIAYTFSDVKEVEGTIANAPSNFDQPIFEKIFLTSDLTLRPNTFILMGGLHRTEQIGDQPPIHSYRWFVLVRGSSETAKIQIRPQITSSFTGPKSPQTFPDLDSFDIEVEVTPDSLILSGETVSTEELLEAFKNKPKDSKILIKVAPTTKLQRIQSVLETLQSKGFQRISFQKTATSTGSITIIGPGMTLHRNSPKIPVFEQ
ncbi:ExbD/TolR family protein [Puniceicoccus vermicola]|uniref:Uncharacterized protein n=1 Tax=Puniceicoccus vermicola TaxID=388746 RepID=A0A7X1E6N3_9BACT|nr:hypothetical protein [Puniceicoccus vermicola]MBC2602842.1 hypothetical protein [Puniceicoccus vermicola]